MPVRDDPIRKLRQRRDALRAALAQVADMRPGSLVERYRRCGKPNCHCAREGERGHGPSFSLTHAVKGKTVTKIIPPEAVVRTRQQIEEYQQFRALGQELVDASERLCDAELRIPDAAASTEGAMTGSSSMRSLSLHPASAIAIATGAAMASFNVGRVKSVFITAVLRNVRSWPRHRSGLRHWRCDRGEFR